MPRASNLGRRSVGQYLVLVSLCFLIAAMPQGAVAEEEEDSSQALAATIAAQNSLLSLAAEEEQGGGSGSSSGSSYWKDHFTLHGYLTTAYQELDPDPAAPNRSAEQFILGLDPEGTFDYRIAALQLRYDPNPKNTFLVQLSHRKLGDSPIEDAESAVELDWLFYQYSFTDDTSIKLGRFPVAAGIFNEIRDVGVVLPFFRPSFTFYREGSLFSETVDGIGVSHTFWSQSPWSLDVDAYYGEYDVQEQGGATTTQARIIEVEATDAYGIQFWLNTPVNGLRFGLGGATWDLGPESGFNDDEANWDSWYASVDGSFAKWVARAEYRRLDFPINNQPVFVNTEAEIPIYYLQLGYHFTDKLSLYAQTEEAQVRQTGAIFLRPLDFTNLADDGLSLVFALRPNIVFKGEFHQETFELVTGVAFVITPQGPKLDLSLTEFEDEYFIISASVSF